MYKLEVIDEQMISMIIETILKFVTVTIIRTNRPGKHHSRSTLTRDGRNKNEDWMHNIVYNVVPNKSWRSHPIYSIFNYTCTPITCMYITHTACRAKQTFNCLPILYVLRTTVIINNFLVKVDLGITRRIIGKTLRNQFGAYSSGKSSI